MIRAFLAALVVALFPAAAHAETFEQMKAACYLGTEPPSPGPATGSGFHSQGITPQHYAGVLTVSPREAKCAIDRFPELLVIAPMRDLDQIPNAVPVPWLALNKVDPAADAKVVPLLQQLTAGDRNRPILVYCHHASCGYSPNAAQHLLRLGYPNVLWMREGVAGWKAAKYPMVPIEKVRSVPGEPGYAMWIGPAGDTTLACFGEKRLDACDLKVYALTRIFNDPELPENQKELVGAQLFNAAAVRAENIREKDGAAASYADAASAWQALKQYAAGRSHDGVIADNAKVVRELVIASIETGRSADVPPLLAAVRQDGAKRFKQLAAAKGNKDELKSVHESMVGMEHFERDLGEFAMRRASDLYDDGKAAQAAPYRKVAEEALDHAVLWVDRNADEGIGTQMDLDPFYRLAEIKQQQGDLARKAGDKVAARKAYLIGASAACALAKETPNDEYGLFADKCDTLQRSYFVMSPEFEKWSAEQAKKEYDFYMSLLKD